MEHSEAYVAFKQRTQEIFDFAVLVTLSVPVLKHNIKLYTESKIKRLQDPDYFEPSVIYRVTPSAIDTLRKLDLDEAKITALNGLRDQDFNNREFKEKVVAAIGEDLYKVHRNILKQQSEGYISNILGCTTNYQSKLATYLYFSTFSYFEAYIGDVITEVSDKFEKVNSHRYLDEHRLQDDLIGLRIKLNKPFDGRKKDKYLKLSKELAAKGYKTPQQLLFSSTISLLETKIRDLKANEIPDFLERYFLYKLAPEDVSIFGTIRANRNSIGHGESAFVPSLKDVIEANKFFKKLSSNLDKHLVFHFSNLNNFDLSSMDEV